MRPQHFVAIVCLAVLSVSSLGGASQVFQVYLATVDAVATTDYACGGAETTGHLMAWSRANVWSPGEGIATWKVQGNLFSADDGSSVDMLHSRVLSVIHEGYLVNPLDAQIFMEILWDTVARPHFVAHITAEASASIDGYLVEGLLVPASDEATETMDYFCAKSVTGSGFVQHAQGVRSTEQSDYYGTVNELLALGESQPESDESFGSAGAAGSASSESEAGETSESEESASSGPEEGEAPAIENAESSNEPGTSDADDSAP